MVTTSHHITIYHDVDLLQVRGNLLVISGICRAIGEEVMLYITLPDIAVVMLVRLPHVEQLVAA